MSKKAVIDSISEGLATILVVENEDDKRVHWLGRSLSDHAAGLKTRVAGPGSGTGGCPSNRANAPAYRS